jgi:hypothetical protein
MRFEYIRFEYAVYREFYQVTAYFAPEPCDPVKQTGYRAIAAYNFGYPVPFYLPVVNHSVKDRNKLFNARQ